VGKRTSQTTTAHQPRARGNRRSLIVRLLRVLAIIVVVLTVLYVGAAWYFSGQIESGALAPPTSYEPGYDWEVVESGTTISLLGDSGTDQAGEAGLSGIRWDGGSGQSSVLVSSSETDEGLVDVRSMEMGSAVPPVGTDVNVDFYYWHGTPLETIGVPYTDVEYRSDVGNFPAWYIEGDSDTWAIVVHGKGGTRDEATRIIPSLMARGYHILIITYRNDVGEAGDPSGRYTYGASDWYDIDQAVGYAKQQGAKRHILVGYSYAGSIISSYLVRDLNETSAVILDSPVLSLSDAVDFRASRTSLPLLPIDVPQVLTNGAKLIASWRFDIDWDATNYLLQTNRMHPPMLIFHGTNDISVPIETSRELADLRSDIVTLVETDAGHTRSWNVGPDSYESAIATFLGSVDG
jgi:pimeloyl-ACP methyl ester carboxylesterase